jgi:hypothetical protein
MDPRQLEKVVKMNPSTSHRPTGSFKIGAATIVMVYVYGTPLQVMLAWSCTFQIHATDKAPPTQPLFEMQSRNP